MRRTVPALLLAIGALLASAVPARADTALDYIKYSLLRAHAGGVVDGLLEADTLSAGQVRSIEAKFEHALASFDAGFLDDDAASAVRSVRQMQALANQVASLADDGLLSPDLAGQVQEVVDAWSAFFGPLLGDGA